MDDYLSVAENENLLKIAPQGRLIVAPEDINVGNNMAIYGIKENNKEIVPIMGQSFKVVAIQLPYVIGTLYADPTSGPVTLDVRFLDFMNVSEDYCNAQTPNITPQPKHKRGPQE